MLNYFYWFLRRPIGFFVCACACKRAIVSIDINFSINVELMRRKKTSDLRLLLIFASQNRNSIPTNKSVLPKWTTVNATMDNWFTAWNEKQSKVDEFSTFNHTIHTDGTNDGCWRTMRAPRIHHCVDQKCAAVIVYSHSLLSLSTRRLVFLSFSLDSARLAHSASPSEIKRSPKCVRNVLHIYLFFFLVRHSGRNAHTRALTCAPIHQRMKLV